MLNWLSVDNTIYPIFKSTQIIHIWAVLINYTLLGGMRSCKFGIKMSTLRCTMRKKSCVASLQWITRRVDNFERFLFSICCNASLFALSSEQGRTSFEFVQWAELIVWGNQVRGIISYTSFLRKKNMIPNDFYCFLNKYALIFSYKKEKDDDYTFGGLAHWLCLLLRTISHQVIKSSG